MDLKNMQIGAVFPHNEIGTDPSAIKAYAQGVEALGISHLLIYDHVLGADPDREGGFRGPYDKDVAFHEPLTHLRLYRRCDRKARNDHHGYDSAPKTNGIGGQTSGASCAAVKQSLPPRCRGGLEPSGIHRPERDIQQSRASPSRASGK